MENKALEFKLGYVGTKPGDPRMTHRDSDSWYTPQVYMDAVKNVLGPIDLDPFTSEESNQRIGASHIFTQETNAFTQEWPCVETAFMNPPYGKDMAKACERFVEEYLKGTFREGIVLTNNATETKWFGELLRSSSGMCMTNHRIRFEAPDGKKMDGSNTRGQVFFYFGEGEQVFRQHFSPFGYIVHKMK